MFCDLPQPADIHRRNLTTDILQPTSDNTSYKCNQRSTYLSAPEAPFATHRLTIASSHKQSPGLDSWLGTAEPPPDLHSVSPARRRGALEATAARGSDRANPRGYVVALALAPGEER